MSSNDMLTAGAIGFAAFALYYITRGRPAVAGVLPLQPGQVARDQGLYAWYSSLTQQQNASYTQSLDKYLGELKGMNIL